MSDIFISYSSEDKSRVQALARALERKGWSVWWDRRIPAGKSFDEVIHEALKAARSVVVVWTKTSVKSTWVKNESRSGMRRGILFPVMLLDEVEIPLEFEHLQAAHLMDWQPGQDHAGFDQFIDDLTGVIGPPVMQSQAAPASSMKPRSEPEIEPLHSKGRVPLSGNNNLSALTLSPGTLEPTFSARTTDYTVNVGSNVSSVKISATKADPDAVLSGAMTIGSGTSTGQATIPLNGPGTVTPAVLTVTAPNGSSETYRIIVNRAALSGNNNLSALTISSGFLSPAFSTNTLNYTVPVGSNVSNVTISATKADSNAVISGDVSAGAGVATGQSTIQLGGPGTTTGVTIWVTAPGGSQKTYMVNVSRAAKVEPEPERWESEPSAATAGAVNSDSPRASFRSQAATEFLEIGQESGHVNDDRSSASTAEAPSTPSLPIFPIGIGLLAAIGALVYFVVFSQGPSPGERKETPYQPPVQSPSTRTEVIKPPPVREPITKLTARTTQEKPEVKQEGTTGKIVASKPRPIAGLAKTITGKDGAPMVLVSAGDFIMGYQGSATEAAHPVYLDAYYIDKYEVTTARYASFFQGANRAMPQYWSDQVVKQHGDKPVVGVDWNDANAYCIWAGKRLPTEAEWEKAARGTDQRWYPWGNETPNDQLANFDHCCDFKDYGALTDVGSYEAGKSPYGVYDMAGNVNEWVADWWDDFYYSKSSSRNPKGPSNGISRVVRGGNWQWSAVDVGSPYRVHDSPTERKVTYGFRCAQDIPK
ncbi:MAG: hypothetical protein CV089_13375 [Nitrospira sp. WS110]|nr:hypothetical protein [Nitrospira sp. WS110]